MALSRTALVTGGNRGIGEEVVKILLAGDENICVFMGCRSLESGQALASSLCETYGPRVQLLQLDVTSNESIAKAVETVGSLCDHLDILVNNAGILGGDSFEREDALHTIHVNFQGALEVTSAFTSLLSKSSHGGHILSTSSGCGTRTLGLMSEDHRKFLMDPSLDASKLQDFLRRIVDEIHGDPDHIYRSIPTLGYGISKMGLNCLTQIFSRWNPSKFRANACSPGFCNTGMCASYTGSRPPKDPALGATVFAKVIFGELGKGKTETFFKECSKPGTPLESATSAVEDWVSFPAVGGQ